MQRSSPVTWLVVLAAVLIAAFVGSTILVERNARLIDERASDIADNAAPSISELAAARTEMRHLELGVGRYVSSRMAGLPFEREQLDVWRAAVDEHLAAYARGPFFPDEREPYSQLADSKVRLYGDLDRVLALVDSGRAGAARTRLLQTVQRHADEIDALIARLITVNNTHAEQRAREITVLRRRNLVLAILLDALSVALGAVLLYGAVRAARLYQRVIEQQRRLAEARAAELGHFAARVAHDLKAPLASMVLGSSVAAAYPSETQKALARIGKTSRLMSEMIDALLAVARVEPPGGRPRATCVATVLDVLLDEVRPTAAAVKAELAVEPYPSELTVACPAGVLASVLSNILHNAVKYVAAAPRRLITVRVRADERARTVRFQIEDTGPGVPPELEEHVFERYVRGQESTGLGLGLATVKRLVEGAHGRLGVKSVVGKGSCFWVELPRVGRAAAA
jgi:signal transduction histidine kinase